MSPEKRDKKASEIRSKTSKQTKQKDYNILDVNQQAVEKALKSRGVTLLIHGHTHRPAEHQFMLGGMPAKRIVLGDWGEDLSFFKYSEFTQEIYY